MNSEDRILVENCLNNDRRAQKQLVNQYGPAMYAIISRYQTKTDEAEDILQQVFILVFQNLPKFRFDCTIGAWIKKITLHTIFKKHKIKWNNAVDHHDQTTFPESSWAPEIESTIEYNVLLETIHKLPPMYKEIFFLYTIDGFTHQEIASLLDISSTASRSRLFRAKELLQEMVSGLYQMHL